MFSVALFLTSRAKLTGVWVATELETYKSRAIRHEAALARG